MTESGSKTSPYIGLASQQVSKWLTPKSTLSPLGFVGFACFVGNPF
jgi:hypothetical protein